MIEKTTPYSDRSSEKEIQAVLRFHQQVLKRIQDRKVSIIVAITSMRGTKKTLMATKMWIYINLSKNSQEHLLPWGKLLPKSLISDRFDDYCDDTSLYYSQCQKQNISLFKLSEKLEFLKPLAVFFSMESPISTKLPLPIFFDRFLDPNKFWNLRLIWSNSTLKLLNIGLASLHSGVAIYVHHVLWDFPSWFRDFVFLSQRRSWEGKSKKSIRTS